MTSPHAPSGRSLEHPARDEIRLEDVLHALADPMRLRIVLRSWRPPRASCPARTSNCPVTKSTTTHHFRVLRESGVIRQVYRGTAKMNGLRRDDLDELFPGLLDGVLPGGRRQAGRLGRRSRAGLAAGGPGPVRPRGRRSAQRPVTVRVAVRRAPTALPSPGVLTDPAQRRGPSAASAASIASQPGHSTGRCPARQCRQRVLGDVALRQRGGVRQQRRRGLLRARPVGADHPRRAALDPARHVLTRASGTPSRSTRPARCGTVPVASSNGRPGSGIPR